MTISCAKLVNPEVTFWYHCISRCVRHAYLFGEGGEDSAGLNRKAWLDERLRFLNEILAVPVAEIARTPEESDHTSSKERVDHVASQGRTDELRAAEHRSVTAIKAASKLEDDLWLIPIEGRRAIDSDREGMLSGFTLGNYLMLVEHSGRIFRNGKAPISSELADIFDRIGTTAEVWQNRVKKMFGGRWYGTFIASSRQRLRGKAKNLGFHHLANAGG